MDRAEFWSMIAFVDLKSLRRGDEEAAVATLVAQLATQNEATIAEFDNHLARVLFDLDTRAHADAGGEASDSPDSFLYARCWVVANGRKHYENVLADPRAMPRTLEEWCEPLLYVAQDAWARRTGNDPEAWESNAGVSYESYSNTEKWK